MDLFTKEQKITLYFQKNNNMVEMTCVVEKIYDDRLDLILPQYFMRYIDSLQVGKKVTAKAFSKLGTIDFNTIIISSPLEDKFTIELDVNSLKLTTGESLPVIKAVEHMEYVKSDGNIVLKTFEISTEYIKFYYDKKINVDTEMDCLLKLPNDYGTINFKAMVTEIDPIYDNEYTATYVTMTETARQMLLYYMYMYTKDTD